MQVDDPEGSREPGLGGYVSSWDLPQPYPIRSLHGLVLYPYIRVAGLYPILNLNLNPTPFAACMVSSRTRTFVLLGSSLAEVWFLL